jgi:hypothetical protein
MAQQPLNTYKTVTGIVSTTDTEIYNTRSGYTSIILSAQVANTGSGIGTITCSLKRIRKSQSGITTEVNELIKDAEIPKSDSLVIVEGRIPLERTATRIDSLIMSGISTTTPNHLKYTVGILETLNQ